VGSSVFDRAHIAKVGLVDGWISGVVLSIAMPGVEDARWYDYFSKSQQDGEFKNIVSIGHPTNDL